MIQVAFVLSHRSDFDLQELYDDIGSANFIKIARYSVLSLLDSNYITKLQNLYQQTKHSSIKKENSTYLIRLSFSGKNEEFVSSFFQKIKPRKKSLFVKNLIRSCLGFENLISLYFTENIIFNRKTLTRIEIDGISNYTNSSIKKNSNKKRRNISKPKIVNKPVVEDHRPSMPILNEPSKIDTFSSTQETISQDVDLLFNEPESDNASISDDDVLSMLSNILG